MLGLGMLGLHDLGVGGWRWWTVDIIWATAGGLITGSALGALIGTLVVYLRARHKESIGLGEFPALGLIALAYGLAVLSHFYGFLAVLAAEMALQRVKEQYSVVSSPATDRIASPCAQQDSVAAVNGPHADQSSADIMRADKGFNEQMERIGELAIVLVVGTMLTFTALPANSVGFLFLLFLVIRPASVWPGLLGGPRLA
jgi:NhaP-type Na+/H+ or K+/H+ antiporter